MQASSKYSDQTAELDVLRQFLVKLKELILANLRLEETLEEIEKITKGM